MAVDFERLVDAEAKNIADNHRYYILNLAKRAMQSKEFVRDIELAVNASPLAERSDWTDSNGQFQFEWYCYQHDGGKVEYALRRDESVSVIAPVIKWMTTHGWTFVATPNPESQRIVYHLTRGDSCGNVVVRIGQSKSCTLVETGEEEIIPSRVIKKYRIECDGSVDEPMQSLESLPVPDGDEEQLRVGFVDKE